MWSIYAVDVELSALKSCHHRAFLSGFPILSLFAGHRHVEAAKPGSACPLY